MESVLTERVGGGVSGDLEQEAGLGDAWAPKQRRLQMDIMRVLSPTTKPTSGTGSFQAVASPARREPWMTETLMTFRVNMEHTQHPDPASFSFQQ